MQGHAWNQKQIKKKNSGKKKEIDWLELVHKQAREKKKEIGWFKPV